MKPFSKLKKQIENLFAPELNMQFCCSSYPIRAQYSNNAVARFYVRLGKEIIWDFPKDFHQLKKHTFHTWSGTNMISELTREYIDAPLDGLLEREFLKERENFSHIGAEDIDYHLTELFKAADRRLGKEKLIAWSYQVENPRIDKIIEARFGFNRAEANRMAKEHLDELKNFNSMPHFMCRTPMMTHEILSSMNEKEREEFRKAEEKVRKK